MQIRLLLSVLLAGLLISEGLHGRLHSLVGHEESGEGQPCTQCYFLVATSNYSAPAEIDIAVLARPSLSVSKTFVRTILFEHQVVSGANFQRGPPV